MTDKPVNIQQASSATLPSSTSPSTGRIVVGVDGSAGSTAAVEWAVQEARLRGGGVHLVVAWQNPRTSAANVWALGLDPSIDPQRLLDSAAADGAARIGEQAARGQNAATTWEAVEGHPAKTLLDVAKSADLLVVGSRGHGGFVGALLGSVSQHVVAHASCPVVVIPAPERRHHIGGS